MRNLILILFLVATITSAQSQWVRQPVPTAIDIVHSIDFQNASTGIASGYLYGNGVQGKFVRTTNSGSTWLIKSLPDSISTVSEVQHISGNMYYAVADYYADDIPLYHNMLDQDQNLSRGGYSTVCFLKTTDSGGNWNILFNLPQETQFAKSLYFLDENTGYIAADRGYSNAAIYKTTNGGLNWSEYQVPDSINLRKITFTNSLNGFAVGSKIINSGYYGVLLKTTNGGDLWTEQLIPNTNGFNSVSFADSDTGFICGGGNFSIGGWAVVFKTIDGGVTWNNLNLYLGGVYSGGIDFLENGTGVFYGPYVPGGYVDRNIIMKTHDYGNTWIEDSLRYTDPIYCSHLLDSTNWYFGGGYEQGAIFHTTTGGTVFINQIGGIIPSDYILHQNYPNPFNPLTKIKFSIPSSYVVTLKVYDMLGREVRSLVDEKLSAGNYEVDFSADGLNSGIYFYRLRSESADIVKKMMYIK